MRLREVSRLIGYAITGAIGGLLITLGGVVLFVEMDMVLPFYVIGTVMGAVVGALVSLRKPRESA